MADTNRENESIEEALDVEIAKAESLKRRRFNPFRAVMGKQPTQKELSNWSHDRWMDLVRFALVFIEKNDEEEVYRITDEKRLALEDYLSISDHPFQEFIWRIDLPLDEATNRQYYYKLTTMTRVCFTYLKKHPALVNGEMRAVIESYPKRLGWIVSQYKTIDTRAGEIVGRDGMTLDGNASVPIKLPSIQAKMMSSLVVLADAYEIIARSLSEKDISKMDTMEKIKSLKDLSFIFATATKKQQTNHFSQININTKDAKAVEEGMLDFIKKSQEK